MLQPGAGGGRQILMSTLSRTAPTVDIYFMGHVARAASRTTPARGLAKHEKKTSWGKREYQMNNSTKILYNHLKDYPTSTEGYHDVSIPAVAAALRFENKSKKESRETPPRTDVQEKSGRR